MRGRLNPFLSALLLVCLFSQAYGETIYFLVAEQIPNHNDSYVLPISDSDANDIVYARNLASGGMAFATCVVADIAAGADGINRNYLSPVRAPWNWHVTNFVSFVEVPPPILDGWPGLVQNNVDEWMNNTGGQICFFNYTVVAELGTDPKPWRCDFDSDSNVTGTDYAKWATDWRFDDCNAPGWCGGKDLTQNGAIDYNDLAIFADSWLDPCAAEPVWSDCWNNGRQCHGDADGLFAGKDKDGARQWVSFNDLDILNASWGSKCGDEGPFLDPYNPCADCDRDCDVDDDDANTLLYWFNRTDVPNDCATDPCL